MAVVKIGEGKTCFTYYGIEFKQNPQSPPLLAFVAPSNDITKFSGVARKTDLLSNYQRGLDMDRIKNEVTPFFKNGQNCSPTAIVLSLHESPLAKIKISPLDVKGLDENILLRKIEILFDDPTKLSEDQLIKHAKAFLDARIGTSVQAKVADNEDESSEEVYPEEADDTEDNGDEEPLEIGKSMLIDLRSQLNDPEKLTDSTKGAITDLLLPALIIDGQHRTFGAAAVEENIPLLVCALVSPDWKEQVFQFMVVNAKAQGIPKPFITSLAGMSLTEKELGDLRIRLAQAKVRLWEVEVMQKLAYNEQSAFNRRISFRITGKAEEGLGYETMKRVGLAWYKPKALGLLKLMDTIYGVGKKKVSKRVLLTSWHKSEDWFNFLCRFWNAFKIKFSGTPLWELKSHLMTAVVLEVLQDVFLSTLQRQSSKFWVCKGTDEESRRIEMESSFDTLVKDFVDKFEVDDFEGWEMTSLNHSDGKNILRDYFDKIILDQPVHKHPLLNAPAKSSGK